MRGKVVYNDIYYLMMASAKIPCLNLDLKNFFCEVKNKF